jgi:hypothetical protein
MLRDPTLRTGLGRWIGYVEGRSKPHWDPFAAQVIYSRYSGPKGDNLPYAFRSDYLKRVRQAIHTVIVTCVDDRFKIFVVLVFGPQSLFHYRTKSWPRKPTTSVFAHQWNLSDVSVGAIAACATLVSSAAGLFLHTDADFEFQALYLLSTDSQFQEIGAASGINYLEAYRQYYGFLYRGYLNRTRFILDLFGEWNDTFFRDRISMDEEAAEQDYHDTMAALDAAPRAEDTDDDDLVQPVHVRYSPAEEEDELHEDEQREQHPDDHALVRHGSLEAQPAQYIVHSPYVASEQASRHSSPLTEDNEDAATQHP